MKLNRKSIIRLVLGGFVLFLLIYWFMFTGQQFLRACAPMMIGVVIAYPLDIMITFFRKHNFLYHRRILKSERVSNILCVILAMIVLIGCAALIAGYIGPQLTACVIALLDKVPSGIRFLVYHPITVRLIPEDTLETLQQIDWNNWINHLVSQVSRDELFRNMTTTATSALSAFSNILFGILFACYFLSGRKKIGQTYRRMIRAFVPQQHQEAVLHSGALLRGCFHNFIICQALQALIIGVSATVLMNIFRFPYASMIGTMNGFCALVPVIGGYVGAVMGTLMILTDNPGMALFFLIFIVVLQNVIGTLVFPRIVGQSLGIPSGWTLAAVLVGTGLGGVTGILIAVPLTAFGYRMVKEKLEEREKAAGITEPAEKAPPEKQEEEKNGAGE